jgi:cobalamin synthase
MFILMIPVNYDSIQRNEKYRKRSWYVGVVLLFLGVVLVSFNTYLILFHSPIIPLSIGLYSLGLGIILNGATHILFIKRFYDKAEKDL